MKKIIVLILSFTMFFINVKATNINNKLDNWLNECNVNLDEYVITYQNFYYYQNIDYFKYIIIDNNSLEIKELNIYSDDELINYEVINLDTKDKDIIILELEKNIEFAKFRIELDFNNKEIINYNIYFTNDYNQDYFYLQKKIDTTINIIDEFNYINYANEVLEDNPDIKFINTINLCHFTKKNIPINNTIDKTNKEVKSIDNNKSYIKEIIYNNDNNNSKLNKYLSFNPNYENTTKEQSYHNEDSNYKEKTKTITEEKNIDLDRIKPNNKFINTLKISNDKSIIKYLIIVVIILTIIYIMLSNKKEKLKK